MIDSSVEGRVVIVTGASRGIGLGIAPTWRRAGAHLVVTGRKPERLAATSARARRARAPTPRPAARHGRPRRHGRARRGDGRPLRPGRRARRQRPDLPAGHPARPRSRRATWTCCSTPDPRAPSGPCRRCSRTCATRGGGASSRWGRTPGWSAPPDTARTPSSKEAIRALTRTAAREWGPARDHRQLRVPGVGRPPHAAGRRPGPRRRVRGDLQGHAARPGRRRRGRHRAGGGLPALRGVPLRDRPDLHGRRRQLLHP